MQAADAGDAFEHVRAVKRAHEGDLMALPNVVAVGVGLAGDSGDDLMIVVSVTHKVPFHDLAPEERIPSELEGVRVQVQATGPLVAGG